MRVDVDADEHDFQVLDRIDAMQIAGRDQRVQAGEVLAALAVADKQRLWSGLVTRTTVHTSETNADRACRRIRGWQQVEPALVARDVHSRGERGVAPAPATCHCGAPG